MKEIIPNAFFMTSFFHSIMLMRFLHVVHVAIVHLFSLMYNISLPGYELVCLSIDQLMDICVFNNINNAK